MTSTIILNAELHVDKKWCNIRLYYWIFTAHNKPEKFQIWNYENCFVKKLQYYTYMYGRDYSNNYSLTICWIKKNFKSWYLQQEILFFSNALQNEINDDNEIHLTCTFCTFAWCRFLLILSEKKFWYHNADKVDVCLQKKARSKQKY